MRVFSVSGFGTAVPVALVAPAILLLANLALAQPTAWVVRGRCVDGADAMRVGRSGGFGQPLTPGLKDTDDAKRVSVGARIRVQMAFVTPERDETIASVRTDDLGDFRLNVDALKSRSAAERRCGRLVLRLGADAIEAGGRYSWALPTHPDRAFEPKVRVTIVRCAGIVGRAHVTGHASKRLDGELFGRSIGGDIRERDWWKGTDIRGGRFSNTILNGGVYEWCVRCPGVGVSAPVRVEIDRKRVYDLGDLELEPGGVIRGRVAFPDGTPVAALEVSVARRETPADDTSADRPWFERAVVKTDTRGRFQIAGLASGDYRVWLPSSGEDIGTYGTGTTHLAIELRRVRLRIVARDEYDQPAEARRVEVLVWPAHLAAAVKRSLGTPAFARFANSASRPYHNHVTLPADRHGVVRTDDSLFDACVERGSLALIRVGCEGFTPWHALTETDDAGNEIAIRVPLRPIPRPTAARLHVVDQRGRPFDGPLLVQVGALRHGDHRVYYTTTQRSGEAVGRLAPGRYRITVESWKSPQIAPVTRDVDLVPGEQRVEFRVTMTDDR